MSNQDDNDSDSLFQQAMQGVKPVKGKKRHNQQRKPSADIPKATLNTRRNAAQCEDRPGGAALSEAWVEPIDPEQKIEYARPGLQLTRQRQLRQGALPIGYQLDLHGYRIDEARELLSEFLHFCKQEGFTCVRVVHGKSHRSTNRQNTLKSHVNHWLRQIPDVLAFCSAPPSEGGTGSVLVLLKRK